MTKNKLFTKSAFKVALECPWKLHYYRNPALFTNSNEDDPFLDALAEGGFQVGALAKIYCKIDADLGHIMDYDKSVMLTEELMKRENVTIAEAAFRWGDLFVRVDILRKRGNDIEVIEVKAKSWNPDKDTFIGSKPKGSVKSDIRPYVYDVAFQKYVVANALPESNVKAFLMMADKSQVAKIDGLNQMFKIYKDQNGRPCVKLMVDGEGQEALRQSTPHLLTPFDVDGVCDDIIAGKTTEQGDPKYMQGLKFVDFIKKASNSYCSNTPYPGKPALCGTCFKCEFCDSEDDKKSGKHICWLQYVIRKDFDKRPLIEKLNGSDLVSKRSDWVREGKYFMDEVSDEMLMPKKPSKSDKPGLKNYERKILQIGLETGDKERLKPFEDCLSGNTYLDREGLKKEMSTWKFPLHMIDFETTAVALPFYEGLRPYEQVAFQFSHHIIYEDGKIEHAGQYLNNDVTKFPNFEFVRHLRDQLKNDNGTIFRYANHENSILCAIYEQLAESTEFDKDVLMKFIQDITHKTVDYKDVWRGPRDMVDLLDVVKRYFYNLEEMHGSNSLKQVLPAVLNNSDYLKRKYSQPIYGSSIKSLNISSNEPIAWISFEDDGHIDSPYHKLPLVSQFIGMSEADMEKMERYTTTDEEFKVANGGAALTAYNKLLFCDGNKCMTAALREALLRYCELDTMSMVFIWEYFTH